MSSDRDALAIATIRTLAMDAVQAANSGHPGTPMALAPLAWWLFSKRRRHDPLRPEWPDRDRFVLSCGHASMLQYALLHLSGYEVSLDDLKAFRQWGSLTPGHPEAGHTPGVEVTTGPLGQGIGMAVGMAMAEKQLADRFNRPELPVIDHRTWVIASDGDIMEGISHEAASLAGHLQLGKLIVFYDDNDITIDGATNLSMSEDVAARFASYRWHTTSVADGNDLAALDTAVDEALSDPRPSLISVKTIIGFPAPTKQGTSGAHGAPLGTDEIAATREVMGWNHPPFHVPAELDEVRAACQRRGADASASWDALMTRYRNEAGNAATELERRLAGELPAGWDEALPRFDTDAKGLATRKASGAMVQAVSKAVPEFVGGSADLAGSNNSYQKGAPDFVAAGSGGDKAGRNVHFGIREHAMGASINGMALHGGVLPYGATFLVFSDYVRPALRLGALMGCRARYLFTHDSIGLGEDGPTHQPIEHLASLRAIPGFTVLRPGDANEVRECFRAMLDCDGPAALILTRQNVPTLDRSLLASAEGALRGGYVIADAEDAEVIIIATGSELALALEAKETLAGEGTAARVVSMPSWELFDSQDEAYRNEVLPRSITKRVVVEAGIRQGWERYVGASGGFVTLEHFGASAPAETLFRKFGITADAVVAEAKRILG